MAAASDLALLACPNRRSPYQEGPAQPSATGNGSPGCQSHSATAANWRARQQRKAITPPLPWNLQRLGFFPSKTLMPRAAMKMPCPCPASILTRTCASVQMGIWLPLGSSQEKVTQSQVKISLHSSLKPWLDLADFQHEAPGICSGEPCQNLPPKPIQASCKQVREREG